MKCAFFNTVRIAGTSFICMYRLFLPSTLLVVHNREVDCLANREQKVSCGLTRLGSCRSLYFPSWTSMKQCYTQALMDHDITFPRCGLATRDDTFVHRIFGEAFCVSPKQGHFVSNPATGPPSPSSPWRLYCNSPESLDGSSRFFEGEQLIFDMRFSTQHAVLTVQYSWRLGPTLAQQPCI